MVGEDNSEHRAMSRHLPSDASSSSSSAGSVRQNMQGSDDSLKENSPARSRFTTRPSSLGNAGAMNCTYEEPETTLLPKHQRLKHLATELPTLVDSLTKDCLEYEKLLISLRMDHDAGKANEDMWKRMYKQLKRENEEVLKRNLELGCDLDAKKIKIKEHKTKLEGKVEEMDGNENLDELPNTTEPLSEDELQDNTNELIVEWSERLESSDNSEKDFGMGSSSRKESHASDSEINLYEGKPYEISTAGTPEGKGPNGTLRCPFCDDEKKQDYDCNTLFRHATGVAEGSSNLSAKQKANHLALAEYLETYLSNSALRQSVLPASVAKAGKEELFYWPWVGIIANILKGPKEDNCVVNCGYWLKNFSKFKPLEIDTFWDDQRLAAHAVIKFDHNWTGFENVLDFEKSFEADGQSKKEWDSRRTTPGSYIYGWCAREDDYKAEGLVGDYLRKRGGLKTISDLFLESTDRHKMVVNLCNEIDLRNQKLDQLQIKYDEMKMSLSRILDERDEIHRAFCQETKKKHAISLERIKSISDVQEILNLELGNNIKHHDPWSDELNNHDAVTKGRGADGNLLWLLGKQKRNKEKTLKKILELERNLGGKKKLEMGMPEVPLEVMMHLGANNDAALKQIMDQLKEQLGQKVDDLNDLEELNQELHARLHRHEGQLQEARKVIIEEFIDMLSGNSCSIGIKKMGEINEKAFKNACKMRFPPEEAAVKAFELCSIWQGKLKNPEWKPFQIIEDENGNPQELLKEDDEILRGLKDEWGDEIYNAVAKALIDLHEYNPSRCYLVPELWNFNENRKATLKEVIHYILTQSKSPEH